jgi:cold-inducible RNA-binding protein
MRLYVGKLPYSYTEEDLKNLFVDFTTSSVRLVIDRETGRSKGFGFVDIDSKEDAQKAIQVLDKKLVEGKPIDVNEARPLQKREGGGGGGMGRGGEGGARRPFNKGPRGFGSR